MGPEAAIVRKLVKAIEADGGFVFKVHGSAFQLAGLPDLIGCYRGFFFGIEVKVPGKKPKKIQEYRLDCIAAAGGIAFWGDNADDMMEHLRSMERFKRR